MNCKPGDLAYFTGGTMCGHTCQVLDAWVLHPFFGHSWLVRVSRNVPLKDAIGRPAGFGNEGYWPDCYLRPIAGPSLTHTVDIEIDTHQPVPA